MLTDFGARMTRSYAGTGHTGVRVAMNRSSSEAATRQPDVLLVPDVELVVVVVVPAVLEVACAVCA